MKLVHFVALGFITITQGIAASQSTSEITDIMGSIDRKIQRYEQRKAHYEEEHRAMLAKCEKRDTFSWLDKKCMNFHENHANPDRRHSVWQQFNGRVISYSFSIGTLSSVVLMIPCVPIGCVAGLVAAIPARVLLGVKLKKSVWAGFVVGLTTSMGGGIVLGAPLGATLSLVLTPIDLPRGIMYERRNPSRPVLLDHITHAHQRISAIQPDAPELQQLEDRRTMLTQ